MNINPKTAKLLFSIYGVIAAIINFFWFRLQSFSLLIIFSSMLMILYIWVFVKARYFLTLVKNSTNIKSIEINLLRALSIFLICSNCYMVYVNLKYLLN